MCISLVSKPSFLWLKPAPQEYTWGRYSWHSEDRSSCGLGECKFILFSFSGRKYLTHTIQNTVLLYLKSVYQSQAYLKPVTFMIFIVHLHNKSLLNPNMWEKRCTCFHQALIVLKKCLCLRHPWNTHGQPWHFPDQMKTSLSFPGVLGCPYHYAKLFVRMNNSELTLLFPKARGTNFTCRCLQLLYLA